MRGPRDERISVGEEEVAARAPPVFETAPGKS
jgi:hypothetical protein